MVRSIIVFSSILFASAALADCESFTLVSDGSERSVQHVDVGQGGVGNQRIGSRAVASDGGAKGTMHWVGTVLANGQNAPALFDRVWRLDDGEITARQLVGLDSAPRDTSQPSIGNGAAIVLGGSGAYRGAAGHVEISFDGNAVRYVFDITCE